MQFKTHLPQSLLISQPNIITPLSEVWIEPLSEPPQTIVLITINHVGLYLRDIGGQTAVPHLRNIPETYGSLWMQYQLMLVTGFWMMTQTEPIVT